jgi:hypothetical protein
VVVESKMNKRYLPPGMQHAAQAYELLTDHCMHFLKGSEIKIALYIVRRTIGFGKERDRIALDQFCHGIKTRKGRQLDRGTGLSRRAAQQALDGLNARGLLSEVLKAGKANEYSLNWKTILEHSQNGTSAESSLPTDAKSTPVPAQQMHPQPSVQISVVQTSVKEDLDCPNRKKRDSSGHVPDGNSARSKGKASATPKPVPKYPDLRRLLEAYMSGSPSRPGAPPDRIVAEVMDAAPYGATEQDVCDCLVYLFEERELYPSAKGGPRSWEWFPVVVLDYFSKRSRREDAARAGGSDFWLTDGSGRAY